jgi:hypothetical protein
MAQTPAQLLKTTKAQLAKSKARLKALEDEQAILKAANQSTTVNTTTMAGIEAASRGDTGYVGPVDTYTSAKVGTTGKTQAQLDAATNAAAVAKSTGGTVDPVTGYVVPKKKVVVDPNQPPPDDPNDYVVDTFTDNETGDIYQVYKSGKRLLLSKGTKLADANAAAAKARYDAEQAAIAKQAADQAEKRDAFALIQDTMRSYGFTDAEMSELSGFIEKQIIDPNIGPNMAILNMRNLGVYKARFAGNEALVKAGKNALSEYDYLQQENAYDEYFKAYGVGNLSTRAQKATLIGNSVSALEVDKRLNLAVKRVQNSDPEILKQLKAYYPSINDKDLVSYFLNPEATRIDLERKVTASEITSAAVGQGFTSGTSLNALGLVDYGVDRAAALEGYANVAAVLPEATKLGNIYGETNIKYDQMAGEEEFLKASDTAKRKRTTLASKERATFEGSAGNAPGAYSTGYLKKSSAAGLI